MRPSEFRALGMVGASDVPRRIDSLAHESAERRRDLVEIRQEVVTMDVALPAGANTTTVDIEHELGRVPAWVGLCAVDESLAPTEITGFVVRELAEPVVTAVIGSNLGSARTITFAFHVEG